MCRWESVTPEMFHCDCWFNLRSLSKISTITFQLKCFWKNIVFNRAWVQVECFLSPLSAHSLASSLCFTMLLIISLHLALIAGFPVYWKVLSMFPTFRVRSNDVSDDEKWTLNVSAEPAEATVVLTCGCCLTFYMILFTFVIWRKQQDTTGVSNRQFFATIIFHAVFTSVIIYFWAQELHISIFFAMLKDHFSLPVACMLFVAGQFIGCWLFKPRKEVLVFLGIKEKQILNLGVIDISQNTIWRENRE